MTVKAASYSVKVGAQLTLRCTASAPRGTITHAIFEIVNADDSKYLGLTGYDTKSQTATFVGLQPKSDIKVRVTYYYSYRGTYSNQMEVGHGTYTESVTVTGSGTPTDIKINPSGINMNVGETVTAKVVLTPTDAAPNYQVGCVESLSRSYAFDWSFNNGVFTITAKKKGELYLVAQVSDKIIGLCVVYAKENVTSEIQPTKISITSGKKSLLVGESQQMGFDIMPNGATTKVTWKSSDESVASVSSSGMVTAKKEGNVTITATTSNGLSSTSNINVVPTIQAISLPYSTTAVLGFAYQLRPTVSPIGAVAECTWTSSDTSIASVSATGHVIGHNIGKAKVTAKCGDLSTTTEIAIVSPTIIDGANASVRVLEIDAVANRTLMDIK